MTTKPEPLSARDVDVMADTYEISERAAERMKATLDERDRFASEAARLREALVWTLDSLAQASTGPAPWVSVLRFERFRENIAPALSTTSDEWLRAKLDEARRYERAVGRAESFESVMGAVAMALEVQRAPMNAMVAEHDRAITEKARREALEEAQAALRPDYPDAVAALRRRALATTPPTAQGEEKP